MLVSFKMKCTRDVRSLRSSERRALRGRSPQRRGWRRRRRGHVAMTAPLGELALQTQALEWGAFSITGQGHRTMSVKCASCHDSGRGDTATCDNRTARAPTTRWPHGCGWQAACPGVPAGSMTVPWAEGWQLAPPATGWGITPIGLYTACAFRFSTRARKPTWYNHQIRKQPFWLRDSIFKTFPMVRCLCKLKIHTVGDAS